MTSSRDYKITTSHVLFPLSLVAFVLFLMIAFQASQIFRDRDALHAAKDQQNAALEQANKVQAQFTALALGTKKLADEGDKDAAQLVERLKKVGVVFPGAPTAPTPAEGSVMPDTTKP